MARTSFFKIFRNWLHDFGFFGTFTPENENAGGSAICIHGDLPADAIVTHLGTCQGRDHLVNIQSGRHNLVIVKVHFESELTWRQSRGKLRLIHPHWPANHSGVGITLVDFNIYDLDYTRRDSTTLGVIRTLSRIDHIFINLPMAEARDFQCYSHVFENLGKRTIPSDHVAVRLVIQKPTNRGHQSKRIPSWMSKHLIFWFHLAAASRRPQVLS